MYITSITPTYSQHKYHVAYSPDANAMLDELYAAWLSADAVADNRGYEDDDANARADLAYLAYEDARLEAGQVKAVAWNERDGEREYEPHLDAADLLGPMDGWH